MCDFFANLIYAIEKNIFRLNMNHFSTRFIKLLITLLASLSITSVLAVQKVEVVSAKAEQQQKMLILTGSIEAHQNARLAILQPGLVAKIYVDVGDLVNKGEKLLTLDAKLAELKLDQEHAALEAANVELSEANRLYQEVVELSKQQLVAGTLMQERKAGIATATAYFNSQKVATDLQQEIVARHTLYAPFSGIIAQRNIDVGEWLTQQSDVFTLVEQQKLRLKLAIPQEYFQQLNGAEQKIVTVVPDYNGSKALSLKFNRLVGVSNVNTRTFTGYVNLPQANNLTPGMSATAEINLASSDNYALWLPKSALKQHPDGGYSVFSVEENIAKRYIVKVSDQLNGKVAVSGTPKTGMFIISGIELLNDGDVVEVENSQGDSL